MTRATSEFSEQSKRQTFSNFPEIHGANLEAIADRTHVLTVWLKWRPRARVTRVRVWGV